MPWDSKHYPASMKNLPPKRRAKAARIAEGLRRRGVEEGVAIATGIKQSAGKRKGKK